MKYLSLIRPYQWYKNLLVFLALVFSGNLLNISALGASLVAFASFCALSSATYVINDCADRKKDAMHPEKWDRPIASGAVSVGEGMAIAVALTSVGLGLAFFLPPTFLYAALGYFVLSQIYTMVLKHEAFADIIAISVNFVLRAVGGALAIGVWVSPWLIAGVFFLALFLIVGKRRGEVMLLAEKAISQRKTLETYSVEVVSRLSALATAALVISYSLYVFFGEHQGLFVTLPVALYAILRYDSLVTIGDKIARHPHLVFFDARMVWAMVIWASLTLAALYL